MTARARWMIAQAALLQAGMALAAGSCCDPGGSGSAGAAGGSPCAALPPASAGCEERPCTGVTVYDCESDPGGSCESATPDCDGDGAPERPAWRCACP